MAWNTSAVDKMEETCREQADSSCSKRINGVWLDVTLHAARGPNDEYFTYLYNNKRITREQAIKLFGDK